jgi:hypothetical protein
MKMKKKALRCFAELQDGQWVAYCLELGLGAQAGTFEEARGKLEAQIRDLSAAEVHTLMRQGSPLSIRLRYRLGFAKGLRSLLGASRRKRRFRESLPPAMLTC